jgi:hypothetical protein
MKVKVILSIGYPSADHRDVIEIPDEELEGLTESEREDVINENVREWADNYIEIDWDIVG